MNVGVFVSEYVCVCGCYVGVFVGVSEDVLLVVYARVSLGVFVYVSLCVYLVYL